ncbi:PREDICTED: G-protein coupled receptor GRL101-like [Priapulus caudatus]|uniref:G-protein coupled receptor GRL101-like n=1 Tax=Priapulus caudatus TaxID=37621 RepID=A0ABM1DUD6_PRICU|nr:PREDICTED: G-protein coupled receptor GRL101-like [Priapulus caudatus]
MGIHSVDPARQDAVVYEMIIVIPINCTDASTLSTENGRCSESEDVFACDDRQCIPVAQKCNGIAECKNGYDESPYVCGCMENEFQCNDTCIDILFRCDGKIDCGDNKDEDDCESYVCPLSHIKCDNHKCVWSDKVCDYVDDCGDGSDEKNCQVQEHVGWKRKQCNNTELGINQWFFCDGEIGTAKDARRTQKSGLAKPRCALPIRCDGTNIGWHLARITICDGIGDWSETADISFESTTNESGDCSNNTIADEASCPDHHGPSIFCDGRCLPRASAVCNGRANCLQKKDEKNCDLLCNDTHLQCKDSGMCIEKSAWCDFKMDCLDGTDETDCDPLPPCLSDEFRCDSGQCIQQEYRCDYYQDCTDASDEGPDCAYPEQECNWNTEMRCASGQCVPITSWCLKLRDAPRTGCADNSHLTSCKNWTCSDDHQLKCRNYYCIPEAYHCDQKPDCEETWTDEDGCPFNCMIPSQEDCVCQDVKMECTYLNMTSLSDDIHDNVKANKLSRLNFTGNLLGTTFSATTLDPYISYAIVHLDVSNNLVTRLGSGWFIQLSHLQILDLMRTSCCYSQRHIQRLASLRDLDLSGNVIVNIDSKAFEGLSSLRELDLSHQQIERLVRNTFQGLRQLNTLSLAYNKIEHIEDGAFNGLSHLKSLDITNNRIVVIEDNVFNGLPFSQLTLKTDEFRFCCLAKGVTKCLPEPNQFSSCEDLMSNVVLRVCVWVLGAVSLIGNAIVIVWRLVDKRDGQVHSFLITNLAIGDMLGGVYLIVLATVDTYYRGVYIATRQCSGGEGVLCQLSGFVATLSSELSVLSR